MGRVERYFSVKTRARGGGVGGSDKSRSRRSRAVGINLEKVKVVKIYFEGSCFRVIALLKICSSNVYVVAQLLRSIRFSRNLHPTFLPPPPSPPPQLFRIAVTFRGNALSRQLVRVNFIRNLDY